MDKISKPVKRARAPNEKRSRNGCLTCKNRRVKCDEVHPSCGHCSRLNLSCSYAKQYSWDEESLGYGKTFGRSNQFKKSSLKRKYQEYKSNNEFNSFIESTSLSKAILKENITWNKVKNKSIYFINANYDDFEKNVTTEVIKNSTQCSTTSVLMHLLSSLLVYKQETMVPTYTQKNFSDFCDDSYSLELFNLSPNNFQSFLPLSNGDIISPLLEFAEFDQLFNNSNFKNALSLPSQINDSSFLSMQTFNLNSDIIGNKFNLLSSQEKNLLQYFINSICPTCVCYPNSSTRTTFYMNENLQFERQQPEINPYLYLIVPLALKSQIVMDTIMATSAHQLYILGNNEYHKMSEMYSEKAVQQLAKIIKEKQEYQCADWDDVLATVLMLCFREISSNCDYRSSWVSYLNCAKYFLNFFNSNSNISPLFKFFARYFIIHEVMGETAWLEQKVIENNNSNNSNNNNNNNNETHFNNIDHNKIVTIDLNLAWNKEVEKNDIMNHLLLSEPNIHEDRDNVIDVVFGCCPYLISIIHRISNLGRCYEDLELESLSTKKEFEFYIIKQRDQIQSEIENLNQKTQIFNEIDNQSENCIKIIAEIKRLSTLLYLFARVDLETLHFNNGIINNYYKEKYDYMQNVKIKLTQLYALLPECPMSLLWPLFVLGLVSGFEDEERWFVLDRLVKLQKARELGSVKTAKDVVLTVWKELDLDLTSFRWRDMIKGRAESLSLA
ncbi:hypothetical protein C6P42_002294 [Pichia californica]|nr:hypothetical protein C6P42_002294 [[Candida] californica]